MSYPELEQYMSLIREFVAGSLATSEFESKYLDLFKSDETIREEKIFLILDRLFSDVDIYCSDPDIRNPGDLDEKGLKDAARDAYDELSQLI